MKSLGAGIYGLSNQLLDSPWKKVVHGKNRFSRVVSKSDLALMGTDVLTQQLMDVLSSTTWFVHACVCVLIKLCTIMMCACVWTCVCLYMTVH